MSWARRGFWARRRLTGWGGRRREEEGATIGGLFRRGCVGEAGSVTGATEELRDARDVRDVQDLQDALDRYAAAWGRALPPFGAVEGTLQERTDQMNDEGLIAVIEAGYDLERLISGRNAMIAGKAALRSPAGTIDSLARRAGFSSVVQLVAAASGDAIGRAAQAVKVGRATTASVSETGEVLPPANPHVAERLQAGQVSMDAAGLIVSLTERLAGRVAAEELAAAEERLVEDATCMPYSRLMGITKRLEAELDAAGVEPREDELRNQRALSIREDKYGRLSLRGVFDPETGAPLKTLLDHMVTSALRIARGNNQLGAEQAEFSRGSEDGMGEDGGAVGNLELPPIPETRTVAQIGADALADVARHFLACGERESVAPVDVVVRVDLKDLEAQLGGVGFGTIDGIDQPISVKTIRKLACAANILPAVMGGASVPLDMGRERRLFTRHQYIALGERDRGCASCGANWFVEAHHTAWWDRDGGATDLLNGVLLCSRCHHHVHAADWEIRIDPVTAAVSFIPPAHIDPKRRPRPGVTSRAPRVEVGPEQAIV